MTPDQLADVARLVISYLAAFLLGFLMGSAARQS
jgi:hypothetical protein